MYAVIWASLNAKDHYFFYAKLVCVTYIEREREQYKTDATWRTPQSNTYAHIYVEQRTKHMK